MRRVALVVPLLFLGCSDGSPAATPTASSRECGGFIRTADPKAVPSISLRGVTWYELQPQGASRYHFGQLAAGDVVSGRDALVAQLRDAGFEIQSTDAEPPAEAEASFTGPVDAPVEGSLQVIPLCDGMVRVRLRTSPRL